MTNATAGPASPKPAAPRRPASGNAASPKRLVVSPSSPSLNGKPRPSALARPSSTEPLSNNLRSPNMSPLRRTPVSPLQRSNTAVQPRPRPRPATAATQSALRAGCTALDASRTLSPSFPGSPVMSESSDYGASAGNFVDSPPSTADVESQLSNAISPARRDGAVKVVLRVRPFAEKEAATDFSGATHPLLCPTRGTLEVQPAKSSVAQAFKFDHVLWSPTQCPAGVSPARQVDVFHRVGLPTLDAVLNGFNSCVLAYGQTGSGKTYTIMGREPGPVHPAVAAEPGVESDALIHKGLLPRLCEALFKTASGFQDGKTAVFEVSFMEIYCEKVKDLLSSAAPSGAAPMIRSEGSSLALNSLASTSEYKPLKVRQHPVTGVFVEGIRKETVTCWEDCRTLLTAGMKKRATASTAMNDNSSRSHAIFSLTLCTTEGACSRTARMDMVDLAGSERASKTGATGQLLDEANQINLSLAVLRKVIDALVDSKRGNTVPPFRESMLTWVLSDSLGGNSKTTIIATVSPTEDALDETVATMRYAVKARSIVNAARVNESSQSRTLREMHEELQRLRQSQARGLPAELEEARRCLDESQHTVSLLESKLGAKAPPPVLQTVEYHHVRARGASRGSVCLVASEHHRVVPAVRMVVAEARGKNEEASCLGPCVVL